MKKYATEGGYWLVGLSLAALLVMAACQPPACVPVTCTQGGLVRGDSNRLVLALVFTAHDYAEGGPHIRQVLAETGVRAAFFLTGEAYRRPEWAGLIRGLRADGHYLGAHSDQHLLYCDWEVRDSLLVSRDSFRRDLHANYAAMARLGIPAAEAPLFMPPYEWYNDSISAWTAAEGLQLLTFTPGTRSQADYTHPGMARYWSSAAIMQSILDREATAGLAGYILLIHLGAGPARTDKFYQHLRPLIDSLRGRGYAFQRVDELLAGACPCPAER